MSAPTYIGIELGGTKAVCTLSSGLDAVIEKRRIATTSADATLNDIAAFIDTFTPPIAIGIASFGPINLDPHSDQYGVMENTPKPGWSGAAIAEFFTKRFGCPLGLDTDVNAAGLAEYHCGAGRGLRNFIYLTVGTGIGGGAILHGQPVSGFSHPEMGHLALPRAIGDEQFKGACPFHPHCAEGLAGGTAISARWGAPLYELPPDHPAWSLQAEYSAELCLQPDSWLFAPENHHWRRCCQ